MFQILPESPASSLLSTSAFGIPPAIRDLNMIAVSIRERRLTTKGVETRVWCSIVFLANEVGRQAGGTVNLNSEMLSRAIPRH